MKREARRMVLLLTLAVAPAFLNGCILTDLLGGLGGGAGGLGALLGGAGQQGTVNGQAAGTRPLAPGSSIGQTLPGQAGSGLPRTGGV